VNPPSGGPVSADRRSILHVDMDAFFVSVELLDHPELRGRPVVVGGNGPRGVVAAASYEARFHGVFSAMASATAMRLCPDAVFLDGRHGRYAEVSRRVMSIFGDATPLVEPLSLDEAFLDVTGVARSIGGPRVIARRIRARVLDEEGIECSVGIGPNKFIAKLASKQAKPTPSPSGPIPGAGIVEVQPDRVAEVLEQLPVRALWGVGPKTAEKLSRLGIVTVGDVARTPIEGLRSAVGGSASEHVWALAHGKDDRPVVPNIAAKSISKEETFVSDRFSVDELLVDLSRMADAVGDELRRVGVAARTVQLKVRFADFSSITRSVTLPTATDDGLELLRSATAMLSRVDCSVGVRLIGVGGTNLAAGGVRQLRLGGMDPLAGAAGDVRHELNAVVDDVRRRFGRSAIGPTRSVDAPREVRPWGPESGDGRGSPGGGQ